MGQTAFPAAFHAKAERHLIPALRIRQGNYVKHLNDAEPLLWAAWEAFDALESGLAADRRHPLAAVPVAAEIIEAMGHRPQGEAARAAVLALVRDELFMLAGAEGRLASAEGYRALKALEWARGADMHVDCPEFERMLIRGGAQ